MPQLIQNAVFIPEDDTYIISSCVHDFVTHTFKDSLSISVDGGRNYVRRVGDLSKLDRDNRYQEWCLITEDTPEDIADKLLWGTRGKAGDEPLRFRPIKEFTVEHLRGILNNVPKINFLHRNVVEHWLDKKLLPPRRTAA